MRYAWLVVIFLSLAGVALYLVSEYAYPHGPLYGAGAIPVYKEDLAGLPGWVAFYREFNFVRVPLVMLGIGVGGFLISIVVGRALTRVVGRALTRLRIRVVQTLKNQRLNPLAVVRTNSVASIAIFLSVVNFGLLMWQIWPEGTSWPAYVRPDIRERSFENYRQEERIRGLESQVDQLRSCIGAFRGRDGSLFCP